MAGDLNVMQILELGGGAFIDAAYRATLGRQPDPSGQKYYQDCLARGVPKATVLVALASSPEGRGRKILCDGMPELLAMNRRGRNPLWQWLFRSLRIERQTYRLEWKLGDLEEKIIALRNENRNFLERSSNALCYNKSPDGAAFLNASSFKRDVVFRMEKNIRFFPNEK